MLEVRFYDKIEDSQLDFAVIIARTGEKWVFCKHKERDTYEVPGGHRAAGETIEEAASNTVTNEYYPELAKRLFELAVKLKEETGAVDFKIEPVCVYSVKGKTRVNKDEEKETFGMLYVADIFSFEEIHSEIEKIVICDELIKDWTYPLIQPKLIEEAARRGHV